jgi:hypothetical protein
VGQRFGAVAAGGWTVTVLPVEGTAGDAGSLLYVSVDEPASST